MEGSPAGVPAWPPGAPRGTVSGGGDGVCPLGGGALHAVARRPQGTPGCAGPHGCQGVGVPGCRGARVMGCRGARVKGCRGEGVPG